MNGSVIIRTPAAGDSPAKAPVFLRVLVVALSLSIGWGIRGNFGHEIGAMLPGALAAAAAVLMTGRDDWRRRIAFFAAAGAIGWSIGGCMSYMQVIAYTHSGHSPTQLYGFACLFALGALWGAPGGMATALPAVLSRERLTEFFAPIAAIIGVWTATAAGVGWWDKVNVDFRQDSPLYWFDTNWLDALGVIVAVLGLAAVRRRWDFASSLFLHAAVGWWAGFLILVVGLDLRMTPPRGDNWAGCTGMVVALWVFFRRQRLPEVNWASLVAGMVGGVGFAGATLFKLLGMTSGLATNWHSVLEQTYGFINGLGIALLMFRLARLTPRVEDDPPLRSWTEPWAAGFAVLGVTYLNLRQNTRVWVEAKSVPAVLYGLPAEAWHELSWGLVGLLFFGLAVVHRRRPLAIIPRTWLGVGQLLYLSLLWAMVAGNFMRALPGFAPERLITEGVIHLNALLCTFGILTLAPRDEPLPPVRTPWRRAVRTTLVLALLVAVLGSFVPWGITRAVYGDKFAGSSRLHIRFGPNANATKAKPAKGQPHP